MDLPGVLSQAQRLTVEVVAEPAQFAALRDEWNTLAQRTGAPPFLRHDFLRIWMDNFVPGVSRRILLARDARDRLVGALPLLERETTLYGIPCRELSAAANAHSCRFDLLAEDPPEAAAAFWRCLADHPRWDVLRLIDVPEGGAAFELLRQATEAGWLTGTWESLRSPFFPLEASAPEGVQGQAAKLRSNLRRRRRKLEERGQVTFERVTGGPKLDAALEEGLALEARGWKGARGTAIAQDAGTRGFYRELARTLARKGNLTLCFLRLDDRPIAFQYAIEDGGCFYLLKPAYDEDLADLSPGQLLMDEVVRDCARRGLTRFDFLGPDMPWKRDWARQATVHTWIYVFGRTRRGRLLRQLKFRWWPAAKEVLSRWRR